VNASGWVSPVAGLSQKLLYSLDLKRPAETGGTPASSDHPSKFHEDPATAGGAGFARRMKEFDTHEP
jgi:hypothetical protein